MRIPILVVLTLLVTKPVHAEDATLSGICSLDMWNKRLGWTDTVLNHDATVQPTCTLTHNPSGLYAGFWGTFSAPAAYNSGTLNSQPGQELDYYVGWSRTYGRWNVRAQFAYWDMVPLLDSTLDMGELMVRAENNVYRSDELDLYAYGKARWLILWDNVHPKVDTALGLRARVPLAGSLFFNSDALSLSPFTEIIRDDDGGVRGVDPGFLWHVGGSVNWDMTDNVTVRPMQFRVMGPVSQYNNKKVEAVFGPGVTFKF